MEEVRKVLFGKYEMGRLLGQGTFAKVYYGKNLISGESVAIKVINKDRVEKEGMMEQIKREIAVMGMVRHPNVVGLKEVMATRARIFFVMEYVSGGELFGRLASRGKLREELARKYFQQLISAVDFCHSRGVSHRDLKPENLLLDADGDLKVSDFGLSALPDQQRSDGLLHTQCGTPAYVAPEVLRKKGYDGAKADTWSCGVVLYALLAGFLPFQDENLMNMYKKVFKAEYQFPPWFSPEARRLVSKLLVADPERRITISALSRVPWFRRGLSIPKAFSFNEGIMDKFDKGKDDKEAEEENEQQEKLEEEGVVRKEGLKKSASSPAFCNAFELISSMSSGFDLSSLFESKKKVKSTFMSRCSATGVVAKIEEAARGLRFGVARVKNFKVRLQGPSEGRKGRLSMTAEVFEVAPEVTVVEFSKSSGDTLEYAKFYEEDIRPALKDIVWQWQGDKVCDGNTNNSDHNIN